MKTEIINSVIGFNFKHDIKDLQGNLIRTGVTTTYPNELRNNETLKLIDTKLFTHYNQNLLNQIKELRKIND